MPAESRFRQATWILMGSPGGGGGGGGAPSRTLGARHPGSPPSVGFSFGLAFPADNTNTVTGFLSGWVLRLKRSIRRFWSINRAVSHDVFGGILAMTSK